MNMKNIIDILTLNAEKTPENISFRFLESATSKSEISYSEMLASVRSVAASLSKLLRPGDRALLLYPPGIEFIKAFLGCLHAGIIAVPAYPPGPNQKLDRITGIIKSCQPKAFLTDKQNAEKLSSQPMFSNFHVVDTESTQNNPDSLADFGLVRHEIAFLQYTSGSTGEPKGVVVTHQNLMENEKMIKEAFGSESFKSVVGWLPIYHDMGLIGNILHPLYIGATCTFMSPTSFLRNPYFWLKAVETYQAQVTGGPNFAFEHCVSKINLDQLNSLDLSSLELVFTGAEPVHPETLRRFSQKFSQCGFREQAFYPCYGLAEATLFVTGHQKNANPIVKTFSKESIEQNRVADPKNTDDAYTLVSSGKVSSGCEVLIVDPTTHLKTNAVGEIWVKGPHVANGYWGNQELSEATFQAKAIDSEGSYLRTGDLGFLDEGNLFICGRSKDLIIVRGRNIYPQDIEYAAQVSHQGIRQGCVAAFSIVEESQEKLVVVAELASLDVSISEIEDAIRTNIMMRHEVDLYDLVLIERNRILKTTSGKIRRRDIKKDYLSGKILRVNPSNRLPSAESRHLGSSSYQSSFLSLKEKAKLNFHNDMKQAIRKLLASFLNASEESISTNRRLASLGIDSLRAVELIDRLNAELQINISLEDVFSSHGANDFLELVTDKVTAREANNTFTEEVSSQIGKDRKIGRQNELCHNQKSLWTIQRNNPKSTAYNLSFAATICGDVQVERLRACLSSLLENHPALKSYFPLVNNIPVVQLNTGVWNAEMFCGSEPQVRKKVSEFCNEPFDVTKGYLFRAMVCSVESNTDVVLAISMHHLIGDFRSLEILVSELKAAYCGGNDSKSVAVSSGKFVYEEFVTDQIARNIEEGIKFWSKNLAGVMPALDLPLDRQKPEVKSFAGSLSYFSIDASTTEKLKSFAEKYGFTMFNVLNAAFQVFLGKISASRQFCLGIPTTLRTPKYKDTVGYFVNPIPLPVDLDFDSSFAKFVGTVSTSTFRALRFCDTPFSKVVDALGCERIGNRNPLFNVMFSYHADSAEKGTGLSGFLSNQIYQDQWAESLVKTYPVARDVSQFDLNLTLTYSRGGIAGNFEYDTDILNLDTIARFQKMFLNLLESLIGNVDRKSAHASLVSKNELDQLVAQPALNDSLDETIVGLFRKQVEVTPNAVALSFLDESYTYKELDNKTDHLATILLDEGIKKGDFVGVLFDRSMEMLISLMGIMKAGAAYVPMDPQYPSERIEYICADAGIHLILQGSKRNFSVKSMEVSASSLQDFDLEIDISPKDVAYAIYTSGSTGKPKGVVVEHNGVANRIIWGQKTFQMGVGDKVLQKTPYTFDVSVWEMFWPLSFGGELVIAPPELQKDAIGLREFISTQEINHAHFVPSMLDLFLDYNELTYPKLKKVYCSGEALTEITIKKFFSQFGESKELHNLYGPTECSIEVSHWACNQNSLNKGVPIGVAIDNVQLLVLDDHLNPLPVGVEGELYVSGECLARGYLNLPELTGHYFIKNPYGKSPAFEKMYRTGDRVKLEVGNVIYYLGRIDNQVKIRGQRIELGEIESVLNLHPYVKESVVLVHDLEKVGQVLTAYIQAKETGSIAGTKQELHKHLSEYLPSYMLPMSYVEVGEFPLTASGKLDRKALKKPVMKSEEGFVELEGEVEEKIATIWKELLGVEKIGATDSFFKLGGNSLLGTILIDKITSEFGIAPHISQIFQNPTIRSMKKSMEMETSQIPTIKVSQRRTQKVK